MSTIKDDFTEADNVFGDSNTLSTVSQTPLNTNFPNGTAEHRENLLRKYHKGQSSLAERLKKEGKNSIEHLVMALMDEMLLETDNLKGNELIATENGNIRDSTIISDKRIAAIDKAMKIVQAKQEFEKEKGGFDLNSPSMEIVFKYFMAGTRNAFKALNYNDEQSDIFFRRLGTELINWKKDIKNELEQIHSVGNTNVKK